MATPFLNRWGGKATRQPSLSPAPQIVDADQIGRPKMNLVDPKKLPIEKLLKQRWDNPPPAHVRAMVDATVNTEFYRNEHFMSRRTVRSAADATTVERKSRATHPPIQVAVATRIVRDLISLRCKASPELGAHPMTSEDRDRHAARVAESLLREMFEDTNFQLIKAELARTVELHGMGFLYTFYDPSVGDRYLVPPTPEEELLGVAGHLATEGMTKTAIGTIFNMRWDASQWNFSDAHWAMIGRLFHVEEARKLFNDDSLEPDPTISYSDFTSQSTSIFAPGGTSQGSTEMWFENEYVMLYEYYEKPSRDYPDGRYVVAKGRDQEGLVVDDVNPYLNDLPFAYFPALPVVGSPYAMPTLTFLRPLCQVLDARMSQFVSDANIVGRLRLLAERNSGIKISVLKGSGVQLMEYLPGAGTNPPQFLQPPQFPPWVLNVMPMIQQMMEYISGMSDVLRGMNPPGSRSATMISEMMNQAHSLFFPEFISIESGMEKHGQHRLLCAKRYYTVPRLIKTAGDFLEDDVTDFVGADLEGHMRVKAAVHSAQPRSKALRRQQLMEMLQIGIITRNELDEFSEFDDVNAAYVDKNIEKKLIAFEHRAMLQHGMPLMPQDHEDHEMHLRKHNRIRKKPQWHMVPEPLRQAFSSHCEAHKEYMRAQYADMTGDVNAQAGTMQRAMQPQPAA